MGKISTLRDRFVSTCQRIQSNIQNVFAFYNNFFDERIKSRVRLVAVKERIDINGDRSIQTKVMVTMFSLFAEIERDFISERTKQGLAAARARGTRLGRPRESLGKSVLDGKESIIVQELLYGVAKAAIAQKLGASRTSLVNFVRTRGLEQAGMWDFGSGRVAMRGNPVRAIRPPPSP